MQLTGTGFCLELKKAGVGRAVNRHCLCLELKREGLRRAVNRYRFGFRTEESRHGACS